MRIEKKIFPVQHHFLSDFILDYWLISYKEGIHSSRYDLVPPTGNPVLHFSIGENPFFYADEINRNNMFFMGQLKRHIPVMPQPGVSIVGVNFKPYGLYNLLGVSPSLFKNHIQTCDQFFPGILLQKLKSQLNQTILVEEGIYLVETFLLAVRSSSIRANPYFDSLVDRMVENKGVECHPSLLSSSVSHRAVQRYFSQVIGCTPKHYQRLCRHKQLLAEILTKPTIDGNNLVSAYNYFDYSHLNKDFSSFSGMGLREYLSMDNEFAKLLLADIH